MSIFTTLSTRKFLSSLLLVVPLTARSPLFTSAAFARPAGISTGVTTGVDKDSIASQLFGVHRSISSWNTRRLMSSPSGDIIPGRPTWQQTMLRIRDPAKSLPFYTNIMGMTLIDKLDFPQYAFSLYFVTTLPKGETYDLIPGTERAHNYLWSMEGVALELTHNHGSEEVYHPGNQEKDGFGHIAFNCDDVYESCKRLEKAGITFKKKPDEGRMKGLAFAYDPDGYWVEIVSRGEHAKGETKRIQNEFNLSQTMLRVKDPKKSLEFYSKFGMKLLEEKHFNDFSLYFLASSNADESSSLKEQFQPVLELTHNHGTEVDADFNHFSGNEEGRRGFGHVGFLVDDVYKACDSIREMGHGFQKEPDGGSMKGLAFAYDPDGYLVEIIKRGGIDFNDSKVTE